MIDAERRNAANCGGSDDVGRIQPAAKAYFDDAGIGRRARKSKEGSGGGDFEETGLQSFGMVQYFRQQFCQHVVADQCSSDSDPFVKAHEMRAGIDVAAQPRSLNRAAQKGAGRPFAIGAGNMKDRWQLFLRITQPRT